MMRIISIPGETPCQQVTVWQLKYTGVVTVCVFLLTRMPMKSGSRTTAHLWSGLLPVLFLAWPRSSAQESLISEWQACRTRPPSSVIMPTLGHLPPKTCPVTPTRFVQVSLWRPLMWLPPDLWAQMTHSLLPGIMNIYIFIYISLIWSPVLILLVYLFLQIGFLTLDHPLPSICCTDSTILPQLVCVWTPQEIYHQWQKELFWFAGILSPFLMLTLSLYLCLQTASELQPNNKSF